MYPLLRVMVTLLGVSLAGASGLCIPRDLSSSNHGLGECLRSSYVLDVHNSKQCKQCPRACAALHCLRLWTRQLVWLERLQPQAVAPVRYD